MMCSEDRCWYCDRRLRPPRTRRQLHPATRTDEHLVAKSDGGSNHPANRRRACLRCNTFVGNWSLERKVKFRALIRRHGCWMMLRRAFGPRSGRRERVEKFLDDMELPRDRESRAAMKARHF